MSKHRSDNDGIKIIAFNKRAAHDYFLTEKLECGIVLCGSEVKSLRAGKANFSDSYVRTQNGKLQVLGLNISEYPMANRLNHVPLAPRNLLAHKREIRKFARAEDEKGFTIVPTKIYFKHGLAKLEIALAQGKAEYDKRETLKKRDFDLHKRRIMNTRR
ncbi:MAG: SsrA-binding protein SmpB [Planctomycetota bacterium]|nr:SsrA-binding protein SmpB [Planctomycetota bacterium]